MMLAGRGTRGQRRGETRERLLLGVQHRRGATVASELVRRGLLDELLPFVHPVFLGSGRPLFDDGVGVVSCDLSCDLAEHATFPDGVAMHRYVIRR